LASPCINREDLSKAIDRLCVSSLALGVSTTAAPHRRSWWSDFR